MAELVDALGSGPSVLTVIGVQVSSRVIIIDFALAKSNPCDTFINNCTNLRKDLRESIKTQYKPTRETLPATSSPRDEEGECWPTPFLPFCRGSVLVLYPVRVAALFLTVSLMAFLKKHRPTTCHSFVIAA